MKLPPISILTCWGLLSLSGCQERVDRKGRSAFEVLEPVGLPKARSDNKAVKEDYDIVYIPGYFSEDLAKPVYPAKALAAHAGDRVVYVTVVFDENGTVVDVSRSLLGISIEDQFRDLFLAAVREAAASWRIVPPHNVFYGRDNKGERIHLRTEALGTSVDLKFTFESSGKVK